MKCEDCKHLEFYDDTHAVCHKDNFSDENLVYDEELGVYRVKCDDWEKKDE